MLGGEDRRRGGEADVLEAEDSQTEAPVAWRCGCLVVGHSGDVVHQLADGVDGGLQDVGIEEDAVGVAAQDLEEPFLAEERERGFSTGPSGPRRGDSPSRAARRAG